MSLVVMANHAAVAVVDARLARQDSSTITTSLDAPVDVVTERASQTASIGIMHFQRVSAGALSGTENG